jgi:site-specific recombinase XerD
MYGRRLVTFLGISPSAVELDEVDLRMLVSSYIDSLPLTSGKEAGASALRLYWSFKCGKPYFAVYNQHDFPSNSSIDAEVIVFTEHLYSMKRLSDISVRDRANTVKRFCYRSLGNQQFNRSFVTIEVVVDYLKHQINHQSRRAKSSFGTAIRSYASFLATVGFERNARKIMLLPLGVYSGGSGKLPEYISDQAYSDLIACFCIDTERGSRDLAMLYCMGNLGLRAGDVARLVLDDIDWQNGLMSIQHSKSKTPRTIPIDKQTGDAIEAYLLEFRPRCQCRHLFLCTGNELGGPALASQQITGAFQLASEKAGIKEYHGTHTMRRKVATNMIHNGVSIKTIADVLGHEMVTTTMGYLRIDAKNLSRIAQDWPKEGDYAKRI